jgi:hypothetical protein
LDERSHFTQFGKVASDFVKVLAGVPQGGGNVVISREMRRKLYFIS